MKRVARHATPDELRIIIDLMPDRLKLLIVLAAFGAFAKVSCWNYGGQMSMA